MRTFAEHSPRADELATQIARHTAALLEGIEPAEPAALIPAGKAPRGSTARLLRLTEGCLSVQRDGKEFLLLDAGDLINIIETGTGVSSDFAVRVEGFDRAALMERVCADPKRFEAWNGLLWSVAAYFCEIAAANLRLDSPAEPEVRWFEPGQVMIAQGAGGPEVFTLVEGHAEVLVDGVRVGEVRADEIFGALSALTETPRTASVIATRRSMVLAMKRENFMEIMASRPGALRNMVEDMARIVAALNRKVVELEGPSRLK